MIKAQGSFSNNQVEVSEMKNIIEILNLTSNRDTWGFSWLSVRLLILAQVLISGS